LPPGADELIAKIPRNSQSLPNLAALAIGSAPQSAKVDYEGSEKKIVIFNVPEGKILI
jgi:hypothetical protein